MRKAYKRKGDLPALAHFPTMIPQCAHLIMEQCPKQPPTRPQKKLKYTLFIAIFILLVLLIASCITLRYCSSVKTEQKETLDRLLFNQTSTKESSNNTQPPPVPPSANNDEKTQRRRSKDQQEVIRKKRQNPHGHRNAYRYFYDKVPHRGRLFVEKPQQINNALSPLWHYNVIYKLLGNIHKYTTPAPIGARKEAEKDEKDEKDKATRLMALRDILTNSTLSPAWHYAVMYELLSNIIRNIRPPPNAAGKTKIKHNILSDNEVYPEGKGGIRDFTCDKHSCYRVDPETQKRRYYNCEKLRCHSIS